MVNELLPFLAANAERRFGLDRVYPTFGEADVVGADRYHSGTHENREHSALPRIEVDDASEIPGRSCGP
jgi:hypothetical protein